MSSSRRNNDIRKLVTAALCLALAMLLPFVTGNIPQIGRALSPMHLPVLLCGFLCGPFYGLIVGFLSPLMRFLLVGMPPIFPTGLAMSFELAAYGVSVGFLYKLFPKKLSFTYLSLIIGMIIGRVIWGIASLIILGFSGSAFTFTAFITGAFIGAIPGIIAQLVLVPIIVEGLKKSFSSYRGFAEE